MHHKGGSDATRNATVAWSKWECDITRHIKTVLLWRRERSVSRLCMIECIRRTGWVLPQGKARSCVIPYEMYFLSNIYSLYDTLTNLRMRLKKIAFVLKRIVPQAEQCIFEKACTAL